MKLEAIHKTLFRNLLGGGLFIAVIAGVLITLIELKSIDRQLSKISSAESGKISKYYEKFYDNRTDESLVKLNNFIRMSLDHDLFIFIEFLDDRLKRVTQISIKDYKSINSHLNDKFGNFKMTGKYEHKTAFYNGQLFIKIVTSQKICGKLK